MSSPTRADLQKKVREQRKQLRDLNRLHRENEMLEAQLAEKDKRIRELADQKDDLQARLDEALDMVRAIKRRL